MSKDKEYCPRCAEKAHEHWRHQGIGGGLNDSEWGPDYEKYKCGEVVRRTGPHGVFGGCSSYPNCKWSSALPEVVKWREGRKSMRNAMWDIPRPF